MPKTVSAQTGLLTRLRRDQRGNMIMLSAAAIIPLMGMIGAAVDVSRAYVIKSRMQNACDAGALAGRRNMKGADWNDQTNTAARSFFAANFPDGNYGSTDLTYTFKADPSTLVVTGTAKAMAPTSVMQIFGKDKIEIAVTCDAEMQVPNTDVMFVLDTTGSMADTNPGDSASKIASLRTAVTNFYNSLQAAKSSAAQVRYGFVPYATTVNVGYLLQRDWMVDKWTYQSRQPGEVKDREVKTTTKSKTDVLTSYVTESGSAVSTVSYLSLEDCTAPANTNSSPADKIETTSTYTDADGNAISEYKRTHTTNGSTYSVTITGGKCKLTETKYTSYVQSRNERTTTYKTPQESTTTVKDYYWNYGPFEYDVSPLKGAKADGTMAGGSISALINANHAPRTVTWNGCIEERKTDMSTDYTGSPTLFNDLNVDMIPDKTKPDTQWKPSLGPLIYARKSITNWSTATVNTTSNYTNIGDYMSGFYASCPSAAKKLSAISSSDLTKYLNGLVVSGNTYHDIGFLWGLRLLSPTGLFTSENSKAANGGSITRHLIFMTDGGTDTDIVNYEAYGISALDRRRTSPLLLPTNADQNSIVEKRLSYLCTEAKNRSITVWVIAFGTDLTTMLKNCASSGRSFQADNATELNETFSKIAAQISQLRLTR